MTSVAGYRILADRVPMAQRPFSGMAVRKADDAIYVDNFGDYETRNSSTLRLILSAIRGFRIGDFPWVLVYIGDDDAPTMVEGYPTFSYSTQSANYDHSCPDFVFGHWRQTQLDDYEQTTRELSVVGATPPETDLLGWRGAPTHPFRRTLVDMAVEQLYDVELINWDTQIPID